MRRWPGAGEWQHHRWAILRHDFAIVERQTTSDVIPSRQPFQLRETNRSALKKPKSTPAQLPPSYGAVLLDQIRRVIQIKSSSFSAHPLNKSRACLRQGSMGPASRPEGMGRTHYTMLGCIEWSAHESSTRPALSCVATRVTDSDAALGAVSPRGPVTYCCCS